MMTNENAAPLGGVRGWNEQHQDTPLRMGNRPPPAPDVVCFALAGLRWVEGRARFRELGIGPEAFGNGEAAMIAAVLLAEREFTPEELRIIWRDDGRTQPWGFATDWTLDPVWALDVVDRFAAERARWWFPIWMDWIAEAMSAGRPLDWIVRELVRILELLRPLAGREMST